MTAAIAALFIALLALPQTAQAQCIRILGTDCSESAVLNLEGGGSIKWNQENTTLTLNNVALDNKPATTNSWFQYCTKLETIEGSSNLSTDLATGMKCMFQGCSALVSLDLSSFNTEKVTSMYAMFDGCSALTTIYCYDDWKSDVVAESTDMLHALPRTDTSRHRHFYIETQCYP